MSIEKFRFQAHRGDSPFYPENTLVSYKAALDQGYQVIEMDTKFTSDNVCIWLISEVEELRIAVREFGADIIETNGTLKPDALKLV